jgi:hypothetical protein
MTQTAKLQISPKGHIVLPQEFLDELGSSSVIVEKRGNHEIALVPFDPAAERKAHERREAAWKSLQARMARGYDFKHEKFDREELYDRYENSIHYKNSLAFEEAEKSRKPE